MWAKRGGGGADCAPRILTGVKIARGLGRGVYATDTAGICSCDRWAVKNSAR